MEKEKYTDMDVRIHPAFIRFVLARPWLRNVDSYRALRAYEKSQRMKCLFQNGGDSYVQTMFKFYDDIRRVTTTIPKDITDDEITIILKETLFDAPSNVASVFDAAERLVPSILDYDEYGTRNIDDVREIVIRDIFLSLNGDNKDWKSEFCLMMESCYDTAFGHSANDKMEEKLPETNDAATVMDLLNEDIVNTSVENETPTFADGLAYQGENPPSPFVIAYGDRWKTDEEENIPDGCWTLWESVHFRPNVLHVIKWDNDKEVLKKWFGLKADTKNHTYFLHKNDFWFKLAPIDNQFDF